MITPDKKLPIHVVERLRFDLGLPEDYARSVLPDFPDYFQVSPLRQGGEETLVLELVCWSKVIEIFRTWISNLEAIVFVLAFVIFIILAVGWKSTLRASFLALGKNHLNQIITIIDLLALSYKILSCIFYETQSTVSIIHISVKLG